MATLRFGAALLCALLSLGAAAQGKPAFTLDHIVGQRVPGQFVLSPDRQHAVFTAVGRYFGHPLFPAFGEDSNLTLLNLETGARTRLTTGPASTSYPVFSPDGRYVAYESEGDIWRVEIATGATQRLTTHHMVDRSAAWSPDGREIAFVSARWGRSGVYVMSADGEREALREVTPQGFGGQNPVWTPDGQALLFIAAKDTHFYSRGIYTVPAAGGEPVRITPTDDARNNWPSFSPDGQRVAYISDRGGYLNIWTMAADGSDQRQLTNLPEDQDYPENDYIQSMGLRWSPDGRRILHFTNRHGNFVLITVDTRTGAVKELAAEPGQHHPVGWLSNDSVAYVRESHDTPPDLHVRTLNGKPRQLTHSAYVAMQSAHMGGMEPISWESEGGVTVHGFLRKPSWAKPGDKLPGIVFSHTYNVGQSYNQWVPIFSYLVESGYVILMVNHRGSNGYGTAFRDLPRGDWGFAQLQDIESGAALLRATPGVDPERVGMLGYSMGGYLTQLAMTARPGLFKTGVAVFGLGQITGDPERSHQNYVWHLGGTEAEIPDAFNNASPVTHVPKMQSPIMLVHSDGDPIEPVSKVHNFTQAMDKHGKAYEARIYTNEAHGLRLLEHQRDSYERILNFLKQHL